MAKTFREGLTDPLGDRTINCCKYNLIPWLYYNPNTEEIVIRREIIYDLKLKHNISSLELLAEILNWTYSKQYWIKECAKNSSCVHVKLKEFLEFLSASKYEQQDVSKIIADANQN